jgi:hypothetical protein
MTKHVPIIAAQRDGGYLVAGRWHFPTIRLALDAAENFARENPEARPEIMKALNEMFAKLNPAEKASLAKMLNGQGGTDNDPSQEYDFACRNGDDNDNIVSGPADPSKAPPPPTHDDIAEFLKTKGLDDSDIERVLGPRGAKDQFPPLNGTKGGMGGRLEMGMDAILRASNRVLPQRGDRFFSVPRYSEEPPAAATLDGAATDQLEKMYPGIGRVQHA